MKRLFGLLPAVAVLALSVSTAPQAAAEVRLPALFTNHMVLQRDMPVPVWGWAEPGEEVAVVFAGQTQHATADDQGKWMVKLQPLAASDEGRSLVVEGKSDRLEVTDVLVGEVWLCSGQSNMEWTVSNSTDGDLELPAIDNASIRFMTVGGGGSQQPYEDFTGAWQVCSPGTARNFSAVGYYFGKRLHEKINVPVGLIDNSWGGSACEAWIPKSAMADKPMYQPLLERWEKQASEADEEAIKAEYAKTFEKWQQRFEAAKAAGEPLPECPKPRNALIGNHRPANLYNARIAPIMPYAIRGSIWYQGESNAGRAEQYAEMFPLMISTWRSEWGQGDFPFYWVQLADFKGEQDQPGQSEWAELRAAQTQTQDQLESTGEAVIIDLGEGKDIHPRDKRSVADRLARWALAKQYGFDIAHQSPRFESIEIEGANAKIKLTDCRKGLVSFDTKTVKGFAVAGKDQKWVWAKAEITGNNEVTVSSDQVPEPVAVRYAWSDNPVCNLYTKSGLPVTPFRTDDWPQVTAGKR